MDRDGEVDGVDEEEEDGELDGVDEGEEDGNSDLFLQKPGENRWGVAVKKYTRHILPGH